MQKLSQAELLNKLKLFFGELAGGYGIDLAFLYGSWARGFPRADSDVDLAVTFAHELIAEDKLFNIVSELSVALSKVIGREVNVLPVFSDFRKPMLYYNAIILGKPVLLNNPDKYARLFVEAICQMEDFSIFGTKWQRQAAARNFEEIKHG